MKLLLIGLVDVLVGDTDAFILLVLEQLFNVFELFILERDIQLPSLRSLNLWQLLYHRLQLCLFRRLVFIVSITNRPVEWIKNDQVGSVMIEENLCGLKVLLDHRRLVFILLSLAVKSTASLLCLTIAPSFGIELQLELVLHVGFDVVEVILFGRADLAFGE